MPAECREHDDFSWKSNHTVNPALPQRVLPRSSGSRRTAGPLLLRPRLTISGRRVIQLLVIVDFASRRRRCHSGPSSMNLLPSSATSRARQFVPREVQDREIRRRRAHGQSLHAARIATCPFNSADGSASEQSFVSHQDGSADAAIVRRSGWPEGEASGGPRPQRESSEARMSYA
jgi:hypothetical protein